MGLLEPPALTKVAADKRYPIARLPIGIFGGLSVLTSRGNGFGNLGLSNGTDTNNTYRRAHIVLASGSDLRLVFANTTLKADGLNNITVAASIEAPTSAATSDASIPLTSIYPVTFNGQDSVVIRPGGFAISDPIPVSVTAGQYLYTRTNVQCTSGGKWPVGLSSVNTPNGSTSEGHAVGADSRFVITNVHTTQGAGYSPIAIVGTPAGARQQGRTVGLLGDSIIYGSGEFYNDYGFGVRICKAAGVGYVQAGVPGDQVSSATGTTFLSNPAANRNRYALLAGCTDVIDNFGVNDATNGRTTAQLQADKLTVWTALANRGIKVRAMTITPRTSSTDGWLTTGNQTILGGSTTRSEWNAWMRDGAPIDATTKAAVAVGTSSNVLRIGDTGHPAASWFDAAAAVESAVGSGLWAPPTRTLTDAHWASSSAHLLSTLGAFVSGDVGEAVIARGGGASGADYTSIITSISSGTDAVVGGAGFSTAVASGGTAGVGVRTTDGLHPSATGHRLIAAAGAYSFPI